MFTPLEYGCVGLSEEDAEKRHGKDGIEVRRRRTNLITTINFLQFFSKESCFESNTAARIGS